MNPHLKTIQTLIQKLNEIVLDKQAEIDMAVACCLAKGHLLLEDVPGVGKTTLVLSLGRLLGLDTKRVQFTIDLLPADILGGNIYNPKSQQFDFYPGPIFSSLMLADELNRASPRTQSALLQAMEEGQVSIDGKTHNLPEDFMVIATQNPHQNVGTFPLPESQLDRFLMSLELNYASLETETKIFQNQERKDLVKQLSAMISPQDFASIQDQVDRVKVSQIVAQYVAMLMDASRKDSAYRFPLSTRAGVALVRASKAWAFLQQRDYLRPEDVQAVAIAVLGHRLGGLDGIRKGKELAEKLKSETEVPV